MRNVSFLWIGNQLSKTFPLFIDTEINYFKYTLQYYLEQSSGILCWNQWVCPLVCVGGSILVYYCWSILRVSAGMLSEWLLNMAVNAQSYN